MKIALYTLTWNRLELTRHCFEALWAKAGHDITHFVLDQGSTDGTVEFLHEHAGQFRQVILGRENVGIPKGANRLLAAIESDGGCDVAVKFDNDCEVVTQNLFAVIAELHRADPRLAVSPEIAGMDGIYPHYDDFYVAGMRLSKTDLLSGLCLTVPWRVFNSFRFSESGPIYGGEDSELTRHLPARGFVPAYATELAVRHYPSNAEQLRLYPDYFAQRQSQVDDWVRRNLMPGQGH